MEHLAHLPAGLDKFALVIHPAFIGTLRPKNTLHCPSPASQTLSPRNMPPSYLKNDASEEDLTPSRPQSLNHQQGRLGSPISKAPGPRPKAPAFGVDQTSGSLLAQPTAQTLSSKLGVENSVLFMNKTYADPCPLARRQSTEASLGSLAQTPGASCSAQSTRCTPARVSPLSRSRGFHAGHLHHGSQEAAASLRHLQNLISLKVAAPKVARSSSQAWINSCAAALAPGVRSRL